VALGVIARTKREREVATLISWHRGGSEVQPSATRAAFCDAMLENADAIEIDVRRTRDGVLVCVHDADIPGAGLVTHLNWSELAPEIARDVLTYDTFLADLRELDPQRRIIIHLDLKDEGYELDAVDQLISDGRAFFVTTPSERSVRLLRDERPEEDAFLTLGTSSHGLSRWRTFRLRSHELAPFVAIWRTKATGVAVYHRLATRPLRTWCRIFRVEMVVWTVDREETQREWLDKKVSVLTTNRPRRAREIRSE